MLVTIITVSFNAAETVYKTIESVQTQDYSKIQHVFIDGCSQDQTSEIIQENMRENDILVSEPDQGIYDAMNKGIKLAAGEIIAILNADDIYTNANVISKVVQNFRSNEADVVYSNIQYINKAHKITRTWRAGQGNYATTKKGWQPPHPGVFVKRKIYDQLGCFDVSFRIAADYDFLLRVFAEPTVEKCYFDEITVSMMNEGLSNSFRGRLISLNEVYRVLMKNKMGYILPITFVLRYVQKLRQLRK